MAMNHALTDTHFLSQLTKSLHSTDKNWDATVMVIDIRLFPLYHMQLNQLDQPALRCTTCKLATFGTLVAYHLNNHHGRSLTSNH